MTPSPNPGVSRSLKELRAALLADRTITGTAWCQRYAETADLWLSELFASATGGDDHGVALLAVGGYGRGSLAPGSDLDLLLVHEPKRRVGRIAESIWYPIWDGGLPLDHSVRTAKEVARVMDGDIKVALGLLDARLVTGDATVAAEVFERSSAIWRKRTRSWLPALDAVTRARHERFGDLAFLLEPDLKEARGGTRDLHLLRSLVQVAPVVADAIATGAVRRAGETLAAVRVELQRPMAQGSNVLLLQDQDAVAERMGMSDADALMAAVSDAARAISWASDDAWRRVEVFLAGPKRRKTTVETPLERGLVLRDGEVALGHGADPAVDPSLALRAAASSAELDRPLARWTLDRLSRRALAPEGVWPPDVLQAFLRLLGSGRPAIAAVEALDQQGVWMRYLPEWHHVRNRPQRNAYHRFTVDRHLLETTANAATMQSSVARPDMLLLGAIFHDIGKGRPEDHTAIGITVAAEIASRMGLDADDVALLQNLVRYHLLLPDVATRRDLDDPSTATSVAASVVDHTTLELLAELTEADSLATGPAAWSPWKAGLVKRLVELVAGRLEGRPPPDTRAAESDRRRAHPPAFGSLGATRRRGTAAGRGARPAGTARDGGRGPDPLPRLGSVGHDDVRQGDRDGSPALRRRGDLRGPAGVGAGEGAARGGAGGPIGCGRPPRDPRGPLRAVSSPHLCVPFRAQGVRRQPSVIDRDRDRGPRSRPRPAPT